jgi:transposase
MTSGRERNEAMAYSEAIRARMVRRMVGPGAVSVMTLGRESGIPPSTLSRWLQGAASIRFVTAKSDAPSAEAAPAVEGKRPQDWTAMERAKLVLEAAGLTEQELGELLRTRGVHREQLDEWRNSLEDAFAQPRGRSTFEAKRIRELEREVAYKDKALAETAALLVLQKKLQLLFPADEDDDTGEKNDK